jgi:antitoxin ParD1/3/4
MASGLMIGDHFEAFIDNLVSSGRYSSADEVMRDSLRLLEEREKSNPSKLTALRADIAEGINSGPSEDLDMSEIKSAARALHASHGK